MSLLFLQLSRTDDAHICNRTVIEAARLIHAASPEFYDLIPLSPEHRIALLSRLIGLRGTDLHSATAALAEGRVVGAYAAMPAARLRQAQLGTLLFLSKELDLGERQMFREGAADLARRLPPIPPDSYYLARLACRPECRNQGIGRCMIERLMLDAGGADISLHVSRDNALAVGFYRRLGFREWGEGTMPYLAMLKPSASVEPESGGGRPPETR